MKIYEQRIHDHIFQGQSFPLEVKECEEVLHQGGGNSQANASILVFH
jgi:hypothetical protein